MALAEKYLNDPKFDFAGRYANKTLKNIVRAATGMDDASAEEFLGQAKNVAFLNQLADDITKLYIVAANHK